jgi:16S rRNA G966 N2-methylase RsmD
MAKDDDKFTKIAADLAIDVRDLINWGLETGNTTPEKMRLTVAARRDAAIKLIESGMSQREAAKILGCSHQLISKELATKLPKDGNKVATPATRARQANEKKRKAELETNVDLTIEQDLHHGDFRELAHQIADDSVQLIFTDPPYDRDSVDLYRDAAAVAARILKPGGSFIAYSGHRHLPDVLKACSQYLDYWWTIACIHSGEKPLMVRLGIRCGWKPLVWFVKGTRGDISRILLDTTSGGKEKDDHEWQQAESEASYYIEHLTSNDGIVVDFFAGSGTTMAAAQKLGRRCIAFEKNALSKEQAARRLAVVSA